MKKAKPNSEVSPSRIRLIQCLLAVLLLYLLFVSLEFPLVFKTCDGLSEKPPRPLFTETRAGSTRPVKKLTRKPERRMREVKGGLSGLFFDESLFDGSEIHDEFSVFDRAARRAILIGKLTWDELISGETYTDRFNPAPNNSTEECPNSVSVSGSEFSNQNRIMILPCGLTLGSHITVVGVPRWAHSERNPPISLLKDGDGFAMVSHFMIELQGTKLVEEEDPPRILHINPRVKGDWSGKPVIEQNTCYRMQWGSALRCNGSESKVDDETVDGQVKCEKWKLNDDEGSDEAGSSWWFNRLIGFSKRKMKHDWQYPFSEGKLFVLTLRAGMEGYHVNVDGRHITSFPYRSGFGLEDATRLLINGDIDVHSVFAASLPSVHPSVATHQYLDMSNIWKAPALPNEPVELFIGILSAGNHFAERMAVRKSWMQHNLIKSSKIVARFFVALHARQEVNVEVKKEAEYFNDIVVVPYMDRYDLVVLKTVAICEYGVREVAAKNIMKCDDDTFVRLDAIVEEINKVGEDTSFYIGNINFNHKPLRQGKWAVTYEEWREEYYPPYANGPGYVFSSNIAQFIIDKLEERRLRLFKMEDVSMGMWVGKFNKSKTVTYHHSLNFCQYGCIEGYYTSHYQSPRQMICLWDKLQSSGKPSCCNMR